MGKFQSESPPFYLAFFDDQGFHKIGRHFAIVCIINVFLTLGINAISIWWFLILVAGAPGTAHSVIKVEFIVWIVMKLLAHLSKHLVNFGILFMSVLVRHECRNSFAFCRLQRLCLLPIVLGWGTVHNCSFLFWGAVSI